MNYDPSALASRILEHLRKRSEQISSDLTDLKTQPDGVKSGAQIGIARDDLNIGLDQLASAVERLIKIDSALTHELMAGIERFAEGMFASGALLSRDEAVARRFRSKAPEIARAAREHKLIPEHQRQAEIILGELTIARRENPGLSDYKLAKSILPAVNARLREVAEAKSLKAKTLSESTISRRIKAFNL